MLFMGWHSGISCKIQLPTSQGWRLGGHCFDIEEILHFWLWSSTTVERIGSTFFVNLCCTTDLALYKASLVTLFSRFHVKEREASSLENCEFQ